MKKRILMVGAVAFMLAACGNKSTEPTQSTDPTPTTEPEHQHTISETYSSNAEEHWKTCSGCDEKFEEGEHVFAKKSDTPSEDGKSYTTTYECETCGYTYEETFLTKEASLEKLAEDKTKSADKTDAIKKGAYSYAYNGGAPTTGAFEYGTYEGKAAFKHQVTSSTSSDTTYLYYDGETACGYKVNDTTGFVSQFGYTAPTANDFKGVHFTSGFYAPTYNGNIYSVDPIFDNVYQEITTDSNGDLEMKYSEATGTYEFSMGVVRVTYGTTKNYYTIQGTIAFDEATGAVAAYTSNYAQYSANEITLDDELGTFEVAEGKEKAPTSFTYTAEMGEREAMEIPYTYDDFKFTSFGLAYGETKIENGATVEVEVTSTSVQFALDSRMPASASPDFDKFTITVVDAETGAAVSGYPNYSSYNNSFSLPAQVGKTYTATIKTAGGVSFSFSYKGKAPAPKSLGLWFCTLGPTGAVQQANFESKVYIGKPVNILATVDPATADGGYTLECKDEDGTVVTLPKHTGANYAGKQMEYYEFDMQTAGTYTLTATSTADETISVTKTIEVAEAPSLDQVFTGNYYYVNQRGGYIDTKFAFVPNADTEAVDGTLTVTCNPGGAGETVATFSYVANAAGDGVDCTKTSGDCKYASLRFVTNNSYGVNAYFKLSEADVEQLMSLMSESQLPSDLK